MKINIYTPVYHRFEKTKDSLLSIIESFKVSKIDINLYVGVNGVENDEMKSWLESLKSNIVSVYYSPKNLGKAAIVNKMNNDIARKDHDYVMSIDSDMIIEDNMKPVWISDMIQILNSGYGLVATNQHGQSCHHYNSVTEETKYVDGKKFTLLSPPPKGCSGIAGGCILLTKDTFEKIGGYTVFDVYNMDDALIIKKVAETINNVTISKDISLLHPSETNSEYRAWKTSKMKRTIENGPDTKGFFDK